jgi:hypothetical protein
LGVGYILSGVYILSGGYIAQAECGKRK